MVRLTNSSNLPVNLRKNETIASVNDLVESYIPSSSDILLSDTNLDHPTTSQISKIKINPQNMDIDPHWISKFQNLHTTYASVFGEDLPGYNGKFGAISAFVNIGDSLPPQRRGRIPQYSRNLLSELQSQFDQLEAKGVFATPESVGTYAEYVNPSFLVKKSDNS